VIAMTPCHDRHLSDIRLFTESAPLLETSDEAFDRIIGVNLKGVFLCMKREIRQMLRQGAGTIVNIGSVNSVRPATNGPCTRARSTGSSG